MKAKIFLSSILTIALCLSLIVGSTFALFTKTETVNIAVTAGKVDVSASILNDSTNFKPDLKNGGTAKITDGNKLQISKMTPGDSVTFVIHVVNNSNVTIDCKVSAEAKGVTGKTNLMGALKCTATINGTPHALNGDGTTMTMADYAEVKAPQTETTGEVITNITVTVEFPANDSTIKYSDFQDAAAEITFTVIAVQGNGATTNP